MSTYVGIALKKDFAQQIDTRIKGLHFTSRADFIRYCVRKELDRLQDKGV